MSRGARARRTQTRCDPSRFATSVSSVSRHFAASPRFLHSNKRDAERRGVRRSIAWTGIAVARTEDRRLREDRDVDGLVRRAIEAEELAAARIACAGDAGI